MSGGERIYLGEKVVPFQRLQRTPFRGFDRERWALYFVGNYGQIDGDHHKAWVLDQVARILLGTPVVVKLASWSDGLTEWRVETGRPSKAYLSWLEHLSWRTDTLLAERIASFERERRLREFAEREWKERGSKTARELLAELYPEGIAP